MSVVASGTTYESVLLVLKIAFLVLLYLFVWRVVRTAGRDMRLPQESFILRPGGALTGGAIGQAIQSGRLVVTHSEVVEEGAAFWIVDLDSTNGIEVNGKRVKRAKLDDGDTFTVGSTDVTFSKELRG